MTGRARLAVWASALLVAGAVGCLDFAHTNPFDPETPLEIQVTGPDSAFSLQQIITFSYTSKPEWPGVVEWRTSNEALLHSLGDGRYGVVGTTAPPNDTASVVVQLGTHTGTRRVTVRQRLAGFNFGCLGATPPCIYRSGARDASIRLEAHDANGFLMAVFSAQLESRRPDILRIDATPSGQAAAFTLPVSPLSVGTTYVVASAGAVRDSVLVSVR